MLILLCILAINDVHNEMKPAKPMKLNLIHELTIGENSEDENQVFTVGTRLTVDDKGSMYIMDPGNFRVAVFDKKGNFVRSFGAQGEGPGEFKQLKEIRFQPDGKLAVYDLGHKKVNRFNPDGTFASELAFPRQLVGIAAPVYLENGNLMVSVIRIDDVGTNHFELNLYDENFKQIKNILTMPQPPKDWSQSRNPEFWVKFLTDIFEGMEKGLPLTTMIDSKHFVGLRSNVYKASIYDQDGNRVGGFDKKNKPKPFTPDAKAAAYEETWSIMTNNAFLANNLPRTTFDKALAKADVGDVIRPIWAITTFGDKIGILANYNSAKRSGDLDLFDSKGHFIATTEYKGSSQFLYGHGNHLYTTDEDEDGNMVVMRYRLEGLGNKQTDH